MKILLIWNKSSKSFFKHFNLSSIICKSTLRVFHFTLKYLAISKVLSNKATSVIIQFFSWSPRLPHWAAAFVNLSHRAAAFVNNSRRWVVDLKILMYFEASTSRRVISVHNSLLWFFANWGSRTSKFHNLETHLNCRVLLESTLERISIISCSGPQPSFPPSCAAASVSSRPLLWYWFFVFILDFRVSGIQHADFVVAQFCFNLFRPSIFISFLLPTIRTFDLCDAHVY